MATKIFSMFYLFIQKKVNVLSWPLCEGAEASLQEAKQVSCWHPGPACGPRLRRSQTPGSGEPAPMK